MSRKKSGKRKGPGKMDPRYEWGMYALLFTVILTVPVWAFSPFDQGIHLSLIIGSSVTLFGLYGYDKARAGSKRSRVPEIIFHGMSLIGGFIGGFIGMYFFRHKNRKILFFVVIAISAIFHVMLYLLTS